MELGTTTTMMFQKRNRDKVVLESKNITYLGTKFESQNATYLVTEGLHGHMVKVLRLLAKEQDLKRFCIGSVKKSAIMIFLLDVQPPTTYSLRCSGMDNFCDKTFRGVRNSAHIQGGGGGTKTRHVASFSSPTVHQRHHVTQLSRPRHYFHLSSYIF